MVQDEDGARRRVEELRPQPQLPLRAGFKAGAFAVVGFGVFWFTRATGLPELLSAIVGVGAAFGAGWYDCALAWKPYQSRQQG